MCSSHVFAPFDLPEKLYTSIRNASASPRSASQTDHWAESKVVVPGLYRVSHRESLPRRPLRWRTRRCSAAEAGTVRTSTDRTRKCSSSAVERLRLVRALENRSFLSHCSSRSLHHESYDYVAAPSQQTTFVLWCTPKPAHVSRALLFGRAWYKVAFVDGWTPSSASPALRTLLLFKRYFCVAHRATLFILPYSIYSLLHTLSFFLSPDFSFTYTIGLPHLVHFLLRPVLLSLPSIRSLSPCISTQRCGAGLIAFWLRAGAICSAS